MVINWYKKAEEVLQKGDKIEKSYPGKLDGESGYIVISDKRLIFVSEKGLFSKKYNVTMNEPLKEVKLSHKTRYKFDIDSNGSHHIFESPDIPGKIVEKEILNAH